jgi:hypothetical protein
VRLDTQMGGKAAAACGARAVFFRSGREKRAVELTPFLFNAPVFAATADLQAGSRALNEASPIGHGYMAAD